MIRSFLFSIFLFVIYSSHAQVRFGVQAGYNSAKWDYTITPGNWETSTGVVSGFNVGALGMLDVKKHIVLQGALLLNSGGTTLKHRYRFTSSSRKIKLYSLNLPVTARYTFDATNLRFGVGGGFYVAMFLSGTEKGAAELFIINGPPQIQTVDNKVEFGDREFDPSSAAVS